MASKSSGDIVGWITRNGQKIPIKRGQGKKQAIKGTKSVTSKKSNKKSIKGKKTSKGKLKKDEVVQTIRINGEKVAIRASQYKKVGLDKDYMTKKKK